MKSKRVFRCLLAFVVMLMIGFAPAVSSACNGVGGGSFDQFGNPLFVQSNFIGSFQPSFSSFASYQQQPVFFNPAFSTHFSSFAQPLGFSGGFHQFASFNRFNNFNHFNRFNSFNNFASFNNGFNGNFALGRFGAVRPVANFNGRAGVRGPLGFFHPFNRNGRPSLFPRFR